MCPMPRRRADCRAMTLREPSTLAAVALDRTAFDPAPSRHGTVDVAVARTAPSDAEAIGLPVGVKGAVPRTLGLDRATLAAAGFEGKPGQVFVVPRTEGAVAVAVGVGDGELTLAELRDAAAAFARAVPKCAKLATGLATAAAAPADAAAQAVVEGVLLARYRFGALKNTPGTTAVGALRLLARPADAEAAGAGAQRGVATAAAVALARDLANTPPSHLTATRLAELATEIADASALTIEVLGPAELRELGCGGLLGVNAGSTEEPRLIKLGYRPSRTSAKSARRPAGRQPARPPGHQPARLALVGKGIMYDSGGISLKPSDAMHAAMKMDMSGAAAVLATMSALRAVGCPNEVTAFLMCTDNMPSGSAMKLGDVLHIHGGTTVEVHNTDAEGRLVLADGLALAAELEPDAIVDIATLTGAIGVALGESYAGLLGNSPELLARLEASAAATDELVWQLPLDRQRYRKLLDSDIADIKNVAGRMGGSITAAVFLSEFVGDASWAHLDIASTMKVDSDDAWRSKGATGFGTRLLLDFATSFSRPVAE